ncbi:hypothetical protein KIPB_010790, partial [Kipferlia bialata]|eukprot:g10790.t1
MARWVLCTLLVATFALSVLCDDVGPYIEAPAAELIRPGSPCIVNEDGSISMVTGVAPQLVPDGSHLYGSDAVLASSYDSSLVLTIDHEHSNYPLVVHSIFFNGTSTTDDSLTLTTFAEAATAAFDPESQQYVVFYSAGYDYSTDMIIPWIYASLATVVDGDLSLSGSTVLSPDRTGTDGQSDLLASAYDASSGSAVLVYVTPDNVIMGVTAVPSSDSTSPVVFGSPTVLVDSLTAAPTSLDITGTPSGLLVSYVTDESPGDWGLYTMVATVSDTLEISCGDAYAIAHLPYTGVHLATVNDSVVITAAYTDSHHAYMWVCDPTYTTLVPQCAITPFPSNLGGGKHLEADYAAVAYDESTGYINLVAVVATEAGSHTTYAGTAYIATLSEEGEVKVLDSFTFTPQAMDGVVSALVTADGGHLVVVYCSDGYTRYFDMVYVYAQTNMT